MTPGNVRAADCVIAGLLGLLTFGLFAPWPQPSIPLRESCALEPAGRFAFECDLPALAQRTGLRWLRSDLRVYEDGLPLVPAESPGDVRRVSPGSFYTTGARLSVSSSDASDVRTNGRRYELRGPLGGGPFGWPREAVRAAIGAATAIVLAIALLWRTGTRTRRLQAAAFAMAAAGLAIQCRAIFGETPVHVDAGYFLPAAEAVRDGARPYATLYYAYTPLGLYELAAWSGLWPREGRPPYGWYLTLIVLAHTACASLVYTILRRAGVAVFLAALTAVGLLSMTLWFDGGRILLEPLFHLPILVAALLALTRESPRSAVTAGALAALAFLTKQYGGIGLLGLGAYALLHGRRRIPWGLWVGLAFAATLALGLALLAAGGVDFRSVTAQAFSGRYPRHYEAVWLKLFLWSCPPAWLALAVPFLPGAWARPAVRIAVAFGLAACAPFYFRQHQYYFLNIAPWLFILFALGAQMVSQHARWRPAVHVGAALVLLTIPLRAAAGQSPYIHDVEWRSEQMRRGRAMAAAWPLTHPTLQILAPSFYAVTGYPSPAPTVVGFRFTSALEADDLRAGFAGAEGAWIDPNTMYARGADRVLRAAGSSLAQELAQRGFEKRLVLENRFELWTKP